MKSLSIPMLCMAVGVCVLAMNSSVYAQATVGEPIDIRNACNMGFADQKADDQTGGWFDQGSQNDLSRFPTGEMISQSVRFNVINPASNGGKSCIILKGKPKEFFPLESPAIPVGKAARAISFLGACGWNTGMGDAVVTMIVTYEDSHLYNEWAIVFSRHMGGWWKPSDLPHGQVAWRGESGAAEVGVYQFYWINPHPEAKIDSIRLISNNTGAVPAIIAATAIPNSPAGLAHVEGVIERQAKADAPKTIDSAADIRVNFNNVLRAIHPQAVSVAGGFGRGDIYIAPARVLFNAGVVPPIYRFQTHLAEPSPAKGVWDFEKLDGVIDFAIRTGSEPMLCFSGRTKWMTDPNDPYGDPQKHWRPADIEEFADYCAHVVRHFNIERGTPVRYWQIGNEMELKKWTHEFYVKAYTAAARKMREVDPLIRISGPVTCNPNIGWARQLLEQVGDEVDVISYHNYGYSTPFDTPGDTVFSVAKKYFNEAQRYREMMEEQGLDRSRPLFITEANTNPGYKDGTDPKMRSMFGGAWYAFALTQFVKGGGDVFCFFTYDGGFGMNWNEKLFPTWHVAWLLRSFFHGNVMEATSTSESVDVTAFSSLHHKGFMLVNKTDRQMDVSVSIAGATFGSIKTYVLNEQTYKPLAKVVDAVVPLLQPQQADAADGLTSTMQPYEVRVLLLEK